MEYQIFTEEEKAAYRDEMLSMMRECDREFVPPLSARTSTTQKTLTACEATGDVTPYFHEMLRQEIVGVFEDGKLIGYLSYRKDYISDVIGADTLPNIYLSTLISRPAARGKGLTAGLYAYLFGEIFPKRNIYTRTWSKNRAHIHILLDKFCFREIFRVKNGRGEGIDTVYFELKRK